MGGSSVTVGAAKAAVESVATRTARQMPKWTICEFVSACQEGGGPVRDWCVRGGWAAKGLYAWEERVIT